MKKTTKIWLLLILALTAISSCTATTTGHWTPLPGPDSIRPMKIIEPDSNIPPEIALYSGIWEGVYENGRAVTIVIEQIKSREEITAIYSVGPYRNENEAWRRVKGRVTKDNSIELLQPNPFFIMTSTNGKTASSKWNGQLPATLFKKTNR